MGGKSIRTNRRDFLRTTATAAGGLSLPWIVRSRAFAQTAASDRINMGFIGCGGMGGTQHLPWFLRQKDVQVRAVCDVDSGHLAAAEHLVNDAYASTDCATYGDFRELLDREDIEAVLIATPDHWHGLTALAAANAGKNIYCEKPLTNTIGEGRALSDAVARNNVVLQTGCHERSGPNVAEARKIVNAGRLGTIHTVHINLPCNDPHHLEVKKIREAPQIINPPPELDDDFWLGPAPKAPYTDRGRHFIWRFNLAYGGGEMTDRGAHVIDLAHYILGLDDTGPSEISATGSKIEIGPILTYMDYEFENVYPSGVRLIGTSSGERGLRLVGDEGSLFIAVHGGRLSAEPASLLAGVSHHDENAYVIHRREFLTCVRSGAQPVAHVEAGHRTAAACHVNTIAMRLGRDLNWNPESEQFDDEQANELVSPPMRAPWAMTMA